LLHAASGLVPSHDSLLLLRAVVQCQGDVGGQTCTKQVSNVFDKSAESYALSEL
jgi:hypothetical protein